MSTLVVDDRMRKLLIEGGWTPPMGSRLGADTDDLVIFEAPPTGAAEFIDIAMDSMIRRVAVSGCALIRRGWTPPMGNVPKEAGGDYLLPSGTTAAMIDHYIDEALDQLSQQTETSADRRAIAALIMQRLAQWVEEGKE